MKLPLSVLMYRITEDYGYGYKTVNVDISSEYEGIKLIDDTEHLSSVLLNNDKVYHNSDEYSYTVYKMKNNDKVYDNNSKYTEYGYKNDEKLAAEVSNNPIKYSYSGYKKQKYTENEYFKDRGNYLYMIEEDEFIENYEIFLNSSAMSSAVFICICRSEESAVCTLCRELSVVFLFADVKFANVFNNVQNIMKKFDKWEKSFHLSVLRKNSMQDLIDITERLMTHPVLILDNNYSLLAHTRDLSEVGPVIMNIIKNGYASPRDIRTIVDMGVFALPGASDGVRVSRYVLPENDVKQRGLDRDAFYSITYRFITGGRTAGYAVVFHCLSHPTNGYLYLMNMIAERLQLFFDQQHKDDSVSREAYQTFLAAILADPSMPERQMKEQAGHVRGLNTEGRFLLAQMQYDSIDEMSYSFVSWSLRNSMPQFMPFVYRSNFYILKQCKKHDSQIFCKNNRKKQNKSAASDAEKNDFIGKNIEKFLEKDEETLFFKCFRNIEYSCGVSDMFFSLRSLSDAAAQCSRALAAGRSGMFESESFKLINASSAIKYDENSRYFYRYEDIAFIDIIEEMKKNTGSFSLNSPYFTLLNEYDKKNQTDLCRVMTQYILCGCSVTKTAAITYMHRNTILNKIKRAAAVMGDPLEDFTKRVFFAAAYIDSLRED